MLHINPIYEKVFSNVSNHRKHCHHRQRHHSSTHHLNTHTPGLMLRVSLTGNTCPHTRSIHTPITSTHTHPGWCCAWASRGTRVRTRGISCSTAGVCVRRRRAQHWRWTHWTARREAAHSRPGAQEEERRTWYDEWVIFFVNQRWNKDHLYRFSKVLIFKVCGLFRKILTSFKVENNSLNVIRNIQGK